MMDHRFLIRLSLWLGLGCSAAVLSLACHQLFDGELTAVQCQDKDEDVLGPPACPPKHRCVSRACIEDPPMVEERSPLGGPCEADDDCTEGFCLDPAKLALGPYNAPEMDKPFCSTGCCSSAECESENNMVCRPGAADAGRVCVPFPATPGELRGGAECTTDADCRSGLCADERCIDVCCNAAFCEQDSQCVVMEWPGEDGASLPAVWQCAPPPDPGTVGPGMGCNMDDQCSTGLCLDLSGNTGICAEPCCSRHDCSTTPGNPGMAEPLSCAPTNTSGDSNGPTSFNACSQTQPEGADKAVGNSCDDAGECLSGLCEEIDDNGTMKCTDVCCRDDDCGDLDALACRPLKNSTGWALRCVPR